MMRYCVFSLLALLLGSCGGPKGADVSAEEMKIGERAAILSKIVEGIDTAQIKRVPVAEEIAGLQGVMDSVLVGKTGYGMFYLLNSGCSVCIAELIDFSYALKKSGLEIPVYVVPSSRSHVPTVEYYLEQPEMKSGTEIHVLKHSLRGSLITERNRTVVVTYGGRTVEQFVFEP